MKFHIITLFEEACDAYLRASIIGRARKEKKISVKYQTPRDFVAGPIGSYKKVDERPYGGGPGMVMMALPIVKAVQKSLKGLVNPTSDVGFTRPYMGGKKAVIVWFRPGAKQFTNKDADTLAKYSDVVLVCGRYEGIDERAKKILKTLVAGSPAQRVRVKEYAVGEAVYTGGEIPALAIVDAVARHLPGVLGKDASVEERRVASSAVYTRPETILYKDKKYKVPKVLQTGNHAAIDKWRKER